jgi:large subunit ribosomal protein L24
MPRQVVGGASRRKAPQGSGKVHVRHGDRVRVIRGNYAGQEGTVIKVLPDLNRVIVEGVNERTRHVRPTQENPEGGRIKSFEPIDASNVMLIDPSSGEPSRSRKRIAKDGSKERIATRSGNPIPKTDK